MLQGTSHNGPSEVHSAQQPIRQLGAKNGFSTTAADSSADTSTAARFPFTGVQITPAGNKSIKAHEIKSVVHRYHNKQVNMFTSSIK